MGEAMKLPRGYLLGSYWDYSPGGNWVGLRWYSYPDTRFDGEQDVPCFYGNLTIGLIAREWTLSVQHKDRALPF